MQWVSAVVKRQAVGRSGFRASLSAGLVPLA